MTRTSCALIGAGLLAVVGSASAAPLSSWTLNYSSAAKSNCGTVSDCRLEFTSSTGAKVAVYAYSTKQTNVALPSSSISGAPRGSFTAATLTDQGSSGLGIRNAMSGDSNEGTSPEHAADNETYYDMFVFEALSGTPSNFDWESIGIGWAQEYGRSWSGGQQSVSSTADIQFFVGDRGNKAGGGTDFTTMCFSGCAVANNNITDSSSGFKTFPYVNNVGVGTLAVPGSGDDAKGRYMVVSGALNLGSSNALFDAFKLKSVSGTVPEPHALMLLGLGALGMVGFARRRKAS